MIIIIIIIIIICRELGLNKPVLVSVIVSSKVFQVIFNHVVYNTALLLAFCCCSFLLHVIAYLICIILVSGQLVLLSPLPKFLHSTYGQKVCIPLFFKKMSSRLISIIFYPFSLSPSYTSVQKNRDSQCIMYFYSWRFLDQSWFKGVV